MRRGIFKGALVALAVMASLSAQADGFDADQKWRVLESNIVPLPYDKLSCSPESGCFLRPSKEEHGYRVLRNEGRSDCTREERLFTGWRKASEDPAVSAKFGESNRLPVIVASSSTVACPR